MENHEIYSDIVSYLLSVLESDEIINTECKKIYSTLIKVQMNQNLNFTYKIQVILKDCNENLLQKLWFHVFKKSHCTDAINVFKNEVLSRKFDNLWCQDVLNHHPLLCETGSTSTAQPSTSSCKSFCRTSIIELKYKVFYNFSANSFQRTASPLVNIDDFTQQYLDENTENDLTSYDWDKFYKQFSIDQPMNSSDILNTSDKSKKK